MGGYLTPPASSGGGNGAATAGIALWNLADTICRPDSHGLATVAAPLPVSGQAFLVGGPGMVVPAGRTVRGIEWGNKNAVANQTHQWFFLAMPDPDGLNIFTVLATSKDDTNAAWGANTKKKLSLLAADGGSGEWTALADTPVYAGIVCVVSTGTALPAPAGLTAPLVNGSIAGPPLWWGAGPTGLTTPNLFGGVNNIGPVGTWRSNEARLSDIST